MSSAPHDARTPAYEAFVDRKTFTNLDGLRALSIVAVLWHHTVLRLEPLPGASRGFLGVDMFFALSGFLIVTLLLRERDRHQRISLKNFYMRRTLRIFPLYYLVVLLVGVLCFVRGGRVFDFDQFLDGLPYFLTYTSNWYEGGEQLPLAIAWSLAAEEQFYLLWPPVERYLRKLVIPILAALLVYNQCINFAVLAPPFGLDRGAHEILQATFTPILLGVALAHLMHDPRGFRLVHRLLGHRGAAAGCFVALLVVGNLPGDDNGGWHRATLQIVMVLVIAAVVVREDGALTGALRHRLVVRIGKVSYGLYLWHMLVMAFVRVALKAAGLDDGDRLLHRGLLFVAVSGATWAVSELSYRLYEARFLRLKGRFRPAAPSST